MTTSVAHDPLYAWDCDASTLLIPLHEGNDEQRLVQSCRAVRLTRGEMLIADANNVACTQNIQ